MVSDAPAEPEYPATMFLQRVFQEISAAQSSFCAVYVRVCACVRHLGLTRVCMRRYELPRLSRPFPAPSDIAEYGIVEDDTVVLVQTPFHHLDHGKAQLFELGVNLLARLEIKQRGDATDGFTWQLKRVGDKEPGGLTFLQLLQTLDTDCGTKRAGLQRYVGSPQCGGPFASSTPYGVSRLRIDFPSFPTTAWCGESLKSLYIDFDPTGHISSVRPGNLLYVPPLSICATVPVANRHCMRWLRRCWPLLMVATCPRAWSLAKPSRWPHAGGFLTCGLPSYRLTSAD